MVELFVGVAERIKLITIESGAATTTSGVSEWLGNRNIARAMTVVVAKSNSCRRTRTINRTSFRVCDRWAKPPITITRMVATIGIAPYGSRAISGV